jgi:uncharacterized membrane protein
MKDTHPDDTEIQEFILTENKSDKSISEHIQHCETCRRIADQYKNLTEAVRSQERARFDFALTELVMTQLPQKSQVVPFKKAIIYLLLLILISTGGLMLFLFSTSLSNLLAGASQIIVYLILTVIISLTLFQGYDAWYHFKKQMNILNSH